MVPQPLQKSVNHLQMASGLHLWLVWKFKEGGEEKRVVGRRVEGNDSSLPCLDVFKISKGEESN